MKNKIEIGIIGFGRFGILMTTVLSGFFKVKVFHYRKRKEDEKIAKKIGINLVSFKEAIDCDYLLLAVPISKTEALIKKIAPLLKPKTTVIDTCSVKELPCKWLEKYLPKDNQIIGSHPMFGAVTTKFNLDEKYFELKNKQVVLCPIRTSKEKLSSLKNFLEKLKLEVLVVSPEEHDKQNAKTLSFVHFLGRSLTGAGIGEQEIFTPGYTDLLRILPHTNNDDWQLFYDMNNYNSYATEIRAEFLGACNLIERKILKSNTINEFDLNRKLINQLDQKIFTLLEERMACVKKIGEYKKRNSLKIVDYKREREIIRKRKQGTKLDPGFIEKIYALIFKESYDYQK